MILDSKNCTVKKGRISKENIRIFEQIMIKKADVVITANEFRAQFMKTHYKLKEKTSGLRKYKKNRL